MSNAKGLAGFLRRGYIGFDILVMEGYVGYGLGVPGRLTTLGKIYVGPVLLSYLAP